MMVLTSMSRRVRPSRTAYVSNRSGPVSRTAFASGSPGIVFLSALNAFFAGHYIKPARSTIERRVPPAEATTQHKAQISLTLPSANTSPRALNPILLQTLLHLKFPAWV